MITMAGWATKVEGRTLRLSTPGYHAYSLREPIGVVGQIIPWNFPLLLSLIDAVPALLETMLDELIALTSADRAFLMMLDFWRNQIAQLQVVT